MPFRREEEVEEERREKEAEKHRYGEKRGEDIIKDAVYPNHQNVIDSFRKEGCLHPKFWRDMRKEDLTGMFGVHRLVVSALWKKIKIQQQVLFFLSFGSLSLSSSLSHLLLRCIAAKGHRNVCVKVVIFLYFYDKILFHGRPPLKRARDCQEHRENRIDRDGAGTPLLFLHR